MEVKSRTFEDKPAVRERTPLLLGIMGPSGGGKTYSALRLATGIQRVSGGDIHVIDTEANRSKHYADIFKFRHVEFAAPFGPLDYLAAIEHSHKKGAGVIIVDSMSHEHEGPGGVLEQHTQELDRLAKQWNTTHDKVNFAAWKKPKEERRRLINSLLQLNGNFIFTFRAKEKTKPKKGEGLEQLGWMPIAGEEFLYEMTANCLLLPSAGGIPTWRSEYRGEIEMMKKPLQFAKLFEQEKPLDEDMGEAMARWAAGGKPAQKTGSMAEKELTLSLIKQYLVERWPTQSAEDKANKASAIELFFGYKSWKDVEAMDAKKLQQCFKAMTDNLGESKAS